jgi:hypothetical protein
MTFTVAGGYMPNYVPAISQLAPNDTIQLAGEYG